MFFSYLPGFDLVLVVILEDALVAEAQPPWDALLVLRDDRKEGEEECGGERWREKQRRQTPSHVFSDSTLVFVYAFMCI